jgi:hypothetical protein
MQERGEKKEEEETKEKGKGRGKHRGETLEDKHTRGEGKRQRGTDRGEENV